MSEERDLQAALAALFPQHEVKYKPQTVTRDGTRAMVVWFLDARAIEDRLDQVLGVQGWQDEYEVLADGCVICHLRLWIGGVWVKKCDVGSPSAQENEGDRKKAAFSSAFKRAATKAGIGRYLYRVPRTWLAYDNQKKQFAQTPTLPAAFLPPTRSREARPAVVVQAPVTPPPRPQVVARLAAYEAKLVGEELCAAGELTSHLSAVMVDAGFDPDPAAWDKPALLRAGVEMKTFEAARRQAQGVPPVVLHSRGLLATAAQKEELRGLLREVGVTEQEVVDYHQLNSFEAMPETVWAEALRKARELVQKSARQTAGSGA